MCRFAPIAPSSGYFTTLWCLAGGFSLGSAQSRVWLPPRRHPTSLPFKKSHTSSTLHILLSLNEEDSYGASLVLRGSSVGFWAERLTAISRGVTSGVSRRKFLAGHEKE